MEAEFYVSPLFHVVDDLGSSVLVKRFAEHGYDLDEKWRRRHFSIISYCCSKAVPMEKLALLLLELGTSPNGKYGLSGITGLQSAIAQRNKTLFHKLLEHPKIDLDECDVSGQTALHYLARCGESGDFSAFLSRTGFNINAQDTRGFTPLHLAMSLQHTIIMEILLNVPGIRLDITDNQGRTALTVATYWGHTAIAYAFIQNASAFPIPEPGQLSSVVSASIHEDKSLTLILLEKYGYQNFDDHIDFSGKGILHHAAMNDWPDVLESCLSHGSEIIGVNKIDRSGATPLHRAAELGNVASCKVLLKYGASVRFQDRKGRTAAHAAADAGFKDILMQLLQAPNIDVAQKDHQGRSLVHWAASLDWLGVVQTVLSKPGADLTRRDNLGSIPIDIAYGCRCPIVGKFIEGEMTRRRIASLRIGKYDWNSFYSRCITTEVEDESSYEMKQEDLFTREFNARKQWAKQREEIRQQYPEELWGVVIARGRIMAFSPDGQLLAYSSWDNTVRLWDVSTAAPHGALEFHSELVNAVAFSPDGQLLASGSGHKTIRLWDVSTGAPRGAFECHSEWVNAVAFSPDGQLLDSGSSDNTVRLWDVSTRAPRGAFESYSKSVSAMAFSPNGQLLAFGLSDKIAVASLSSFAVITNSFIKLAAI